MRETVSVKTKVGLVESKNSQAIGIGVCIFFLQCNFFHLCKKQKEKKRNWCWQNFELANGSVLEFFT